MPDLWRTLAHLFAIVMKVAVRPAALILKRWQGLSFRRKGTVAVFAVSIALSLVSAACKQSCAVVPCPAPGFDVETCSCRPFQPPPNTEAGMGASQAGRGASTVGCSRAPLVHRAAAETCDREREPGNPIITGGRPECVKDADCTSGENGRCVNAGFGSGAGAVAKCSYDACFVDDACTRGGACVCGASNSIENNYCARGNCHTDPDCGHNGFCSPSLGICGRALGTDGYYCHTCDDECVDDSDCKQPAFFCGYAPDLKRWKCLDYTCVD